MKVLLSLAAVLAGATTLAAPAHADPGDAQFLQTIRNGMGLEVTDGRALIDSAHELCSELKQGTPYKTVVSSVFQGNPGLGPDGAAYFVSASAQAYCPELMTG
ncbi:DUF732 domain-containing protein [Mycobacterium parmense]|uniref:Uncharacterized protein n=1 Tax=Mycobacterium parmense TaxID=185642 RepID=A0A7I7YMN1_9MYCO|nr:DUF732 domain-containing protein [Mycobacterium parmense]MCV7349006.1 DUF732 domain-containing protein [Mycobacterium parmense]ORW58345.1 hypothetical protein AWC20_11560 [Mycobacterium parmense]BBZ43116.1 hypothetical protein MPRM_03970 [Mycobacterium parmense]